MFVCVCVFVCVSDDVLALYICTTYLCRLLAIDWCFLLQKRLWLKFILSYLISYYSDRKALNSLYFPRLVSVVQPHIVNPYSSFDCIMIYILIATIHWEILHELKTAKNMNKKVHVLTYIRHVFVSGQIMFYRIQGYGKHQWSWNLLPIIVILYFLLLTEWRFFEYHLVIELIYVSIFFSAAGHHHRHQQLHISMA